MNVLFGHPTGNPNSYQAALAHFEANRLAAFCVPWMPSALTMRMLAHAGPMRPMAQRLGRRHFPPLASAPKVQGRIAEWRRLAARFLGRTDERSFHDANDWLMQTMRRECRHPSVTAVHAYEDCSHLAFLEARRFDKACIYDMPIGYYPAWERMRTELARKYADWLPGGGLPPDSHVRREQKRREMELADLVLVPSNFVAETVREFFPDKVLAFARYGTGPAVWSPPVQRSPRETITFLFAGQCSLRKGIPLLLEAWEAAGLKHARLQLAGPWQLAQAKLKNLPRSVEWLGPMSSDRLGGYYDQADVFVLPSYFEGRALAIGEAMSSGLPVLSTPASGADDLLDESCGRIVQTGNLEALVEGLRWFDNHRERLPALGRVARARAERNSWKNYREQVTQAVAPFV